MNTEKICDAQLNVSKYYTTDTIEDLIYKLSQYELEAYYNTDTKSIDIEIIDENIFDEVDIRGCLDQWLKELVLEGANKDSIDIIRNNIDFVFNHTKIPNGKDSTVKLYLY